VKKGAEGQARELRRVILYCDGACRGNPGVGGYGVVLLCDGHQKELSGAVELTTNNRMELQAAIAGLEVLKEPCRVRAVTDSQYLKKGISEWIHEWQRRGWKTSKRGDVLNRDLWERLLELSRFHQLEWEWVRGHGGDVLNERCDELANEAIDRLLASRGD
jgi:ribonuclease HI